MATDISQTYITKSATEGALNEDMTSGALNEVMTKDALNEVMALSGTVTTLSPGNWTVSTNTY